MLLQQISPSDLQINVFRPQWLKQRPQTKSVSALQRGSDQCPHLKTWGGCSGRRPCLNLLPVSTLVPVDYLNQLRRPSISCVTLTKSASAAAGLKDLLTPPPKKKRKSAIDSAKCIFILIKRNQIRSGNTSLTLY